MPMNFARLAEDMGALGIRVEKPAEIAPALQRALAAGRPAVIDVATDIDGAGADRGDLRAASKPGYWDRLTRRGLTQVKAAIRSAGDKTHPNCRHRAGRSAHYEICPPAR